MVHVSIVNTTESVFVLSYLASAAAAAVHALLTKSDPRSAMSWIAVCWLFPLGGSVLYWLFGINRVRKRAKHRRSLPSNDGEPIGPDDRSAPIADLTRIGDALTPWRIEAGNSVEPLYNGEFAFPRMLQAISEACHFVWLSTYIFQTDAVGLKFVSALSAAAARGVCVRVIVDGIGEWYDWPHVVPLLRDAGVQAVRFLPPRLFPPYVSLNCRNHRKMLLIDGNQAFVGGMNLGGREVAGVKGRRLTDIHFCLHGPIIGQLSDTYATDWQLATGERLEDGLTAPVTTAGTARCRVITGGPDEDIDRLLLILFGAISMARHKVSIMTPYFIPPPELVAALQSAALRGVEVSLVLPRHSNLRYVDWATLHWLPALVARGVKVFFQEPPFSHAKLFVVDEQYAQIGSANVDTRSLRLNFEIVVEVIDEALCRELSTFIAEVQGKVESTAVVRVLQSSPLTRIRNSLCWLVSPYL